MIVIITFSIKDIQCNFAKTQKKEID